MRSARSCGGYLIGGFAGVFVLMACAAACMGQVPQRPATATTFLSADGSVLCGVSDASNPAAMAAWGRECYRNLRLFVNPTGLNGMPATEFQDAAAESLRNCSDASGLKISLTDDKAAADIELAAESMRSGILAWCQFPASCGQRIATRFNSRVNWSRPLFVDTLTHELGHGFGLPHTGDKRDIMYPSLLSGRGLDGKFGPHYSIPQLVARYGENDIGPVPKPFPPIPAPPAGWSAALQWVVSVIMAIVAAWFAAHARGVDVGERKAMARRQPPPSDQRQLPFNNNSGEP
jgi:hypothetical protein